MAELSPKRAGTRLGLLPTVFATVAALYFCQAVLIPLAIAILLAFLMAPVVTRLERTPLGRVIAVLMTVGVMLSAARKRWLRSTPQEDGWGETRQ